MNTLYIEPFSGLSGDMFLGALCGLLEAYDDLEELPQKLNLPDGRVEISSVEKNGIVCRHVNVVDLNEPTNVHHDHGHKHEHEHPHQHHKHDEGHSHSHSHDHPHSHVHGSHEHRHLSEIIELIDNAEITDSARKISKEIFQLIGKAESEVHNIPIEKIHFHEISAVDSIIDIVGCAVLIDRLGSLTTYSEPVCVGHGMVDTQHGLLPIPAPATAKLLQGIPYYKGDEKGERVTPTGAAILKYLNPIFESPTLKIDRSAYGPGKKNFIGPNVLRLSLGTISQASSAIYSIETNLDDSSSELLGSDFQAQLLEQGAIDFTLTQALMKKGRPGHLLSALASHEDLESVCDFILENTTAIGIRYYPISRKILDRTEEVVSTEFGTIRVKTVTTPSGKERRKAEYEDLSRVAKKQGVSIMELKQSIEGS